MKKIILYIFIAVLVAAAFLAWKIAGPGTSFEGKNYYLLIPTGSSFEAVTDSLEKNRVLSSQWLFGFIAQRLDYPQKVKAGRYNIKSGMSLVQIIRMLRNGQQEPVKLVIIKFHTKEDLASAIGRKFECDSLAFIQFLNDPDSLRKYHLDSNTVMTTVLPDTYTFFWNTTPGRIFGKFRTRYQSFWTDDRKRQAATHGLNPQTAYTLASIVEEETNQSGDKGKIASVYLNRLSKGMRLAADPTVKFALRNFGLKRIYEKYTQVESPYNTYKNAGLPPGPICTPSAETIEAVITAHDTKYLYFVAKPGFSGYSNFAETYPEHLKYAKEYQQFLDKWMQQKAAGGDSSK
jgi:UPF0755 protein